MVYPEIKIKEKRKSFSLKMKISKKDVEGQFFDSEDVTELKRTILEEISYEIDNLIDLMVEDEDLSTEQIVEMGNALGKVSISVQEQKVEVSETEG